MSTGWGTHTPTPTPRQEGLLSPTAVRLITGTLIAAIVGVMVTPMALDVQGIPAGIIAAPVTWLLAMLLLRYEDRPLAIVAWGLHIIAGCAAVSPIMIVIPGLKQARNVTALLSSAESLYLSLMVGIVLGLLFLGIARLLVKESNSRRDRLGGVPDEQTGRPRGAGQGVSKPATSWTSHQTRRRRLP